MDPFTLHVLAGHTDMNTTKRYVHPSEADIREAMDKVATRSRETLGRWKERFHRAACRSV
jgi:hypothetical protein